MKSFIDDESVPTEADSPRIRELMAALDHCVDMAGRMRADGVVVPGWPDLLASVQHVCSQFESALSGVVPPR